MAMPPFRTVSVKSFSNDSGTGLPCHSRSFGFGSKRSTWLGAPDMNR